MSLHSAMAGALIILALTTVFTGCNGQSSNARCVINMDLDHCFSHEPANMSCNPAPVCQKEFKINDMSIDPYDAHIIGSLLSMCCGPCVNVTIDNSTTQVSKIKPPADQDAPDFLYPVLGTLDDELLYDHHFIPLIEVPTVYYFGHKRHDVILQLIRSCFNMWPLLIISLLMVIISGFFGWLMDTWSNKDQFPRAFFIGWFEGFWWSFISMTTVGYGDKIPKSIPARLFSVFWIFLGITTFSIITALLSAEITKANSEMIPTMDGERVGAIQHCLYESMIIKHYGGTLVRSKSPRAQEAITELTARLRQHEIDGIALDRNIYVMLSHAHQHEAINFLRSATLQTTLVHPTKYFYGILVKNIEDYDFLKDFIGYNRNLLSTCNGLAINYLANIHKKHDEAPNLLFSTSGEVFWPAFTCVAGAIVLICLFGVIYETQRRSHGLTKKFYKGLYELPLFGSNGFKMKDDNSTVYK